MLIDYSDEIFERKISKISRSERDICFCTHSVKYKPKQLEHYARNKDCVFIFVVRAYDLHTHACTQKALVRVNNFKQQYRSLLNALTN